MSRSPYNTSFLLIYYLFFHYLKWKMYITSKYVKQKFVYDVSELVWELAQ